MQLVKNIELINSEYSKSSFYFLSPKNRFRIFLIKLIKNRYFEIASQILIFINSILMLLYTYSERICDRYQKDKSFYDNCLIKYKSKIDRDNKMEIVYLTFNCVFFIEIVIKMLAQGLILHKGAFLRNGWNIIDCFATIYSFLQIFFPGIGNLSVLRVFRLLRILQTISILPGIRRITTSIIISFPSLINVLLFLCFIFLIFGVLGIQLFSGVFYNRCRRNPILIEQNQENPDGIPKYSSPPVTDKICNPLSEQYYKCPEGTFCVNFFDIPKYFEMDNITIDSFDKNEEGLLNNEWLYFGAFNFDNIINCLVNAFSLMTIECWAEALTTLLDGCSSFSSRLYFNMVVIIGGFFIIKLILAAQNEAMTKVNKVELETMLKELNKNEKKSDISISKEENENDLEMKKLLEKNSPKIKRGVLVNSSANNKIDNFLEEGNSKMLLRKKYSNSEDSSLVSINSKNHDLINKDKKKVKFKKIRSLNFGDNNIIPDDSRDIKGIINIINAQNESPKNNGSQTPSSQSSKSSKSSKNSEDLLNPFSQGIDSIAQIEKKNNMLIISNINIIHSIPNLKDYLTSKKHRYTDEFLYNFYNINHSLVNSGEGTSFTSSFHNESIEGDANLISKIKKMTINKIKYMILEEYSNTYQYIIFNVSIYTITALNLVFMCLMSYPMSNKLLQSIDIVNLICTGFFVIELIFKILVLGFKGWFKDRLNIADSIVTFIGIFEIIYVKVNKDPSDDSNSSLSALKVIRYLRILKLFPDGSFIQKFVCFILISLRDLFYYCLLLIVFIYIFAIAGRELFANWITIENKTDKYGYIYNTTQSPRENFDSLINSFVSVFILFIGDHWPNIMYKYIKNYGKSSIIFFVTVIIIGHIMLFNLFLSIMMSNYQIDQRIDILVNKKKNEKIFTQTVGKTAKGIKHKIKVMIKKFLDCCIKKEEIKTTIVKRRNHLHGVEDIGKKFSIEEIKKKIPIERTSLLIFSRNHPVRLWCSKFIQEYKGVYYFYTINNILSLILLALDSPSLTNKTMKKIILSLDIYTTLTFLFEAIIKSIAFGFLFNGRYSYLRDEYNFIDFVSLILSTIYIIASSKDTLVSTSITNESTSTQVFRVIKILRLVRVIKLIGFSSSLKAALSAFYQSLMQMLKIIFIGCLFILMFTIIGVNYFRGRFARCDFTRVPFQYMNNITSKWECMDYGGDWINPYPNFDNIRAGFILFFEMMTAEQWTDYMFMAMDATEINKQPKREHSYRWSLFFILYIVFAYFFLLNLAMGILYDNFNKEKEKMKNNHFSLPIQNEFFKIFKTLFKVQVPQKRARNDRITQFWIKIIDSIYFDVVITVCVIANLIFLMINNPERSDMIKGYLKNMNSLLNYVFIVEAAVKLYVYGLGYFSNGWNILDFIAVCESIILLLFNTFLKVLSNILDSSIFLALRVLRVLRLLKKHQSLSKTFNLFINSIPGVMNVLILYFILLYLYSIIGMSLFYNIKYQNILSKKWNYKNFLDSLFVLTRVTTGEGWNTLMHESIIKRDGFNFCKYREEMTMEELYYDNIGCGSMWAFPYYISFVILSTMMFLQFFSVVISATMNDTYALNIDELRQGEIQNFKTKWLNYDKKCSGFMKLENLQKFMYNIGLPLGIPSLNISDFVRVCSLLNIYSYTNEGEKYVYFYDVLVELTKYYFIHKAVEEEWNNNSYKYNPNEMLEIKAEIFSNYMVKISEMQEEYKYQVVNPYNNDRKANTNYHLDMLRDTEDINKKKRTAHFTWAVLQLSSFVRCYKSIKKKTKAVINFEEYNSDLAEYAGMYLSRCNDIRNPNYKKDFARQRKEIHKMNQSIIKEETEKNSSCESDRNNKRNLTVSSESEKEESKSAKN